MRSDRPKRLFRVALVLLTTCACAALLVWVVWPTQSAPTLAQLERVAPGMTRAHAWAAVGAAPGEYPRGASHFQRVGVRIGDDVWRCPECELHVWYDANDRVRDVVVYRAGEAPPARFQVRLLGSK